MNWEMLMKSVPSSTVTSWNRSRVRYQADRPPASTARTAAAAATFHPLPPFFFSEVGVANRLRRINAAAPSFTADGQLSVADERGVEYDEDELAQRIAYRLQEMLAGKEA